MLPNHSLLLLSNLESKLTPIPMHHQSIYQKRYQCTPLRIPYRIVSCRIISYTLSKNSFYTHPITYHPSSSPSHLPSVFSIELTASAPSSSLTV